MDPHKPDWAVPEFVFGAGEMADHAIRLLDWSGRKWDQICLFDDGFPAKRTGPGGLPILGTFDDGINLCVARRPTTLIAVGTKGAAGRYRLFLQLRAAGVPLTSVLHPSLLQAPGATLGLNCIVMSGCTLAKNSTVGDLAHLSTNVLVEHDARIGWNVFLGPSVTMGGHVRIGDHAFIGVGAVILPGIEIGSRAVIGAGAVVTRNVPEGVVASGVPATIRRAVRVGDDAPTGDQIEPRRV